IQTISSNAMAVAFPEMTADLNVSIILAGWVLNVFQLALIVTVPFAGKASDAMGRKRTFMFFVSIFTVGSVLSALAPDIYWLIFFRIIQGIGTGGFLTSAAGIVADTFPENRQRYIGLISSVLALGSVLGPNVGGWLTQSFGWRSTFWFAVPWGVAALLAGAALLKKDGATEKLRLDAKGAVLLTVSLTGFLAGLTNLGNAGATFGLAGSAALLLVGVAFMYWFIRHESQTEGPLIDPMLLRGRSFFAANIFNVCFGILVGVFTFLPLYLVNSYKVSTLQSGLLITPRSLGVLAASVVSSFLLIRWGYRRPMVLGTLMMAAAFAYFGFDSLRIIESGAALSAMALTLVAIAVVGLGQGFAMPAANNACIELMPEKLSTITGLRQASRNLGNALGIAWASIGLTVFGNLTTGFAIVFFGTCIVGLSTLPWILGMPRSPSDYPQATQGLP
ncbi:MAG: MFS transporter, partial [Chloroflexi bacterium]|nr:MFS transporter [Chloroflexota bacterium]